MTSKERFNMALCHESMRALIALHSITMHEMK